MQQDPELVRAILKAFIEEPAARLGRTPAIDGYTAEQVDHHVYLMGRAGLLRTTETDGDMSERGEALAVDVEPAGHAFYAAAKNDALWRRALAWAGATGAGVSVEMLKQWLSRQLPGGA